MNHKKCIFCNNNDVIKKGFNKDKIQRWQCKKCNKIFNANRKAPPNKVELFYSFSFHKQTLKELSKLYHMRTSEVQKIIDEFELPKLVHRPRKIHLLVDATYFGFRENMFCLILFRDADNKHNVWWVFAKTENESEYRKGRFFLEDLGFEILSVTADGLPLIRSVFTGIPFQMCLVHMERIIIRGTTRKPKLEAGKVLLALAKEIHNMNSVTFSKYMYKYTLKYFHFLNEKSYNQDTGERWYTHDSLRKVYLSLQRLQNHLFVYEKDRTIPKTTNSIEGTFTHVKNKLKAHNGLSIKRKKKLIEIFLIYGSGVYDYVRE